MLVIVKQTQTNLIQVNKENVIFLVVGKCVNKQQFKYKKKMMAINEEIINEENNYSGLIIQQQSNDQNNNNLVATSIFSLDNSNTTSSNRQQLNSSNLNSKMHDQLPSTSSNISSMQLATFNNDIWSHSMLKPASRFSISTRRECKVNFIINLN